VTSGKQVARNGAFAWAAFFVIWLALFLYGNSWDQFLVSSIGFIVSYCFFYWSVTAAK
jgi:hypothetical protein